MPTTYWGQLPQGQRMGTGFRTRGEAVEVVAAIGGWLGVVGAVEGVEGMAGVVERLLNTSSSISSSLESLSNRR